MNRAVFVGSSIRSLRQNARATHQTRRFFSDQARMDENGVMAIRNRAEFSKMLP
jgi:hypothetical protein